MIKGIGHYTQEKVVTNQDLEKIMDTSDEWIVERTGIKERRFYSLTLKWIYLGIVYHQILNKE